MTHNTKEYHLLYNHQGSLRAVVDTEGTIIKELHYDSFGTITNDTNPTLHVKLGFAGGLYDEDTKLTRFGYRDYDAYTGKWTAKDPIGFSGGDANLYGYVLGDPVNGIDPSGLYDIPSGIQPVFTGEITPEQIQTWNNSRQNSGQTYAIYPAGPFGGLCGEEGSAGANWIPDISPDACERHDKCYSTCGKSQWQCDKEFFLSNPAYAPFTMGFGKEPYKNAQKGSGCQCK